MSSTSTAAQLVELLKRKGIVDPAVLAAMLKIPRHLFVDPIYVTHAYADTALPISEGQTISQPFVVARMTEILLQEGPVNKVLEIGTGSGYQAAILSNLVSEIYTIERIQSLHELATARFAKLHLMNIHTRFSDGNEGWPEAAPFDGIIVTAATPQVPPALLEQLAEGGRMIIPIGGFHGQELQLIKRECQRFTTEILDPVIFVPLIKGVESTP